MVKELFYDLICGYDNISLYNSVVLRKYIAVHFM